MAAKGRQVKAVKLAARVLDLEVQKAVLWPTPSVLGVGSGSIYFAMRCGRRLPWAGRAGRRLNDKESWMVHWGRPTTPAMARQHKLQLALLLEMDKKESHNTEWR